MIIDRLDEEFLLFSLRRNGRWVSRWSGSVAAGVAGAWVLELLLEGRVKLKEGRLVPRGKSRLDDPVLDGVLDDMRSVSSPRSVGRWVARLSRRPVGRMVQVMQRLQERGYVDHVVRPGLWGRIHRFPQHSAGGRSEMRRHLVEVVQGRKIPDEDTVALLGILDAAGMARLVFGRNTGMARRSIRRLVVQNPRIAEVAGAVRRRRLRRFLRFV